MDITLLSAQKIHDQLQKVIRYFVFDETVMPRLDNIIPKIPDMENMDKYAKQYEKETDDFICKISELLKLEREDTLAVVHKTSDQILITFTIRLLTVSDQLLKSPDKMLPITLDDAQFFCDCLIKYWRAYQKCGDVNFLTV